MSKYNKSIGNKLMGYFQGRLNIKRSTKGYWRCNCPYCGGAYTMAINMEYHSVACFKCDEKVSTIKLLMFMENFDVLPQAYQFLRIQQEYENFEGKAHVVKKEYAKIELPEGFKLISQGEDAMGKAARHYMKKRGFNISSLSLKGVGYGTQGRYWGYIIFPFYRKGELIYYQGRLYMGNGAKMQNPEEGEFGIGKSQLIYNQDALYIYNRAYIVESITNSLTLGDAAIATLGKKVSPNQFSNILLSPCEKVVVILDDDAWKDSVDLCLSLVHYKQTKIIRMPFEVDVNDLGKVKTLKLIKAQHYKKYNELYKLRNEGS